MLRLLRPRYACALLSLLATALSLSATGLAPISIALDDELDVCQGAPTDYCDAKGLEPWTEWISEVSIGDLTRASSKERYHFYAFDGPAQLEAGSRVPVKLTPGLSWPGHRADLFWSVYVDFNRDGDFSDPGETVLRQQGTNELVDEHIIIPQDIGEGCTRIRITMKVGGYAAPCETFARGEVEDFLATLSGGDGGDGGGGDDGAVCAERVVTNNEACSNDRPYAFFGNLVGDASDYFRVSNGRFVEFADGTATLTARLINNSDRDIAFDAVVNFSGRTQTPPDGSPKEPLCEQRDPNTGDFYYYPSSSGRLDGIRHLAGAKVDISRTGEAFQVGTGANLNEVDRFGGSGWYQYTIERQPDGDVHLRANAPLDFNFRLSGAPGACFPQAAAAIDCPADVTVQLVAGETTGAIDYAVPTGNTTCAQGGLQVERLSGPAPGARRPAGDYTVRYRATDACGSTAECSFRVTVVVASAGTALTLTCPPDVTTPQIADYGADVFIPVPNASTTCPDERISFSYSVDLGDNRTPHFPVGTTTVSVSATDNCGNTETCSFTITVTPSGDGDGDGGACAGNGPDYPCGGANVGGWEPWWEWIARVRLGVIDNASSKEAFRFFPEAGKAEVERGGKFTLTVDPGLSYPQYVTELYYTAFVDFNQDGDFDDAGEEVVRLRKTSLGFSEEVHVPADAVAGVTRLRIALRRGQYAGPCENFSFGEVEDYLLCIGGDGEEPSTIAIECPDQLNFQVPDDATAVALNYPLPTASTTCGGGGLRLQRLSGPARSARRGPGTYTVTFSARDACGNAVDCSFDVTVTAASGGTGTVCADRVVTNNLACSNGRAYGFFGNLLAGRSDFFTLSEARFVEFDDGTARLTARLANEDDSALGFDAVVEFTGRTATPPAGSPKAPLCDEDAAATDFYYYPSASGRLTGRGRLTGALISVSRAGEAFQVGTGANLNEPNRFGASGWFDYVIESQPDDGPRLRNGAPLDFNFRLSGDPGACLTPSTLAIDCPADHTVQLAAGQTATSLGYAVPTASTTCAAGGLSVERVSGPAATARRGTGTYAVTYRATDACGNVTECDFDVTVLAPEPNSLLSVECPDDQTVQIAPGQTTAALQFVRPTASTTCAKNGLRIKRVEGPANGRRRGPGTYTIAFAVSDACGNETRCSFDIVVEAAPVTPSEVTTDCPADRTVQIATGETVGAIVFEDPTASTTCADGGLRLRRVSGPARGALRGPGSYTLTFRATDACGNVAECSFDVTVLAAEPPSPDCDNRSKDGLIALYEFDAGSGTTVFDRSGFGTPLNLHLDADNVHWLPDCGVEVKTHATIQSATSASKIVEAVKRTNEITVEAWIQPANTRQNGPARIVTISRNAHERNVTLGQSGSEYVTRLRTTHTNRNGEPELKTGAESLDASLQHVVYTRASDGQERFYVDGQLAESGHRAGNFSGWADHYKLTLANENVHDRAWTGKIFKVAIYRRDLSPDEVANHFEAGQCCEPTPEPPTAEVCDRDVLFVVGDTHLISSDSVVLDKLEDFGYDVTVREDHAARTSDADGKGAIVISSSVKSQTVGSTFTYVAVPVLTWENQLYDELKMTGTNAGHDYGEGHTAELTHANPHPIRENLHGKVDVYSSRQRYGWGRPYNSAVIVAHAPSSPHLAAIFAYDEGAQMRDLRAPAKRIGWYWDGNAAAKATAVGWRQFRNALSWATGCNSLKLTHTPQLQLSARANYAEVDLVWATVLQAGESAFSLERRDDVFEAWTTIGEFFTEDVAGQAVTLSYTDASPVTGENVYRVSTASDEGTRTSELRYVTFVPGDAVSVFPNPADEEIHVALEDMLGYEADIRLINALGQTMLHEHIEEVDHETYTLPVTHLPEGSYVLHAEIGGLRVSVPVAIVR